MAAPVYATLLCLSPPLNNPYGGLLNLSSVGAPYNSTGYLQSQVFRAARPTNVDQTIHNIIYRKNISTGSLLNARFYNNNAIKFNSSAGPIKFTITGFGLSLPVRVTGYSSGVLRTEVFTLAEDDITGSIVWDVNGIRMVERLNVAGGVGFGPDATVDISCVGEKLCEFNFHFHSNLVTFATALTKNTALTGSDTTLPPSQPITDFFNPTKWEGEDNCVPFIDNILLPDEYMAICCRLIIPANFPVPTITFVTFTNNLVGNPQG